MPHGFQGAIFDVDGVLVDSPHEKAWRESLRELMENEWRDIREHTTWSPEAFTPRVYEEQMSGKPRIDGARAALEHFHMPDADDHRLAQYADRKQAAVVKLIEAGDFTAYPDALRFIICVKDAGIRVAAASSSKNANLFLRKIRLDTFAQENGISSASLRPGLTLLEYFDADLSGRDFAHGKPDPEIFLASAHELGVAPADAIVMEDAAAGVQAAKAGGMGAIGIARVDEPRSWPRLTRTSWSGALTRWTSRRWRPDVWPPSTPSRARARLGIRSRRGPRPIRRGRRVSVAVVAAWSKSSSAWWRSLIHALEVIDEAVEFLAGLVELVVGRSRSPSAFASVCDA